MPLPGHEGGKEARLAGGGGGGAPVNGLLLGLSPAYLAVGEGGVPGALVAW